MTAGGVPVPHPVDILEAAFIALDEAHDDLAEARADLRQLRELLTGDGEHR